MGKLANLVTAVVTNGSADQSFIGARWLVFLLRVAPRPFKRPLALRILAISPHYFYRRPEYNGISKKEFLEAEYERNRSTRERIIRQVLAPHLRPADQVLDIGCGPGFLARAVSPRVQRIFACDISQGVLECARVINGAANINYIYSGESGFAQIEDSSLNLAYSFAVFQHVRESIIQSLFAVASQKLRPGGQCVFQVQLDDGKWKSEQAWDDDKSVANRLRLKYGMNFFPRTAAFFQELAAKTGFTVEAIRPLSELLDEPFDDVYYQHLLVLRKS
jgi:SAM-dependent methyltransferase